MARFVQFVLIAGWLVACGTQTAHAASRRAANFEAALDWAKANTNDIVVFQRGSDWNRLAETLYQDVWQKDELLAGLGDGFVLVAVDHPEVIGGRPVLTLSAPAGATNAPPGMSAPDRLAQLADDKTRLPVNEVTTVESMAGVAYTRRASDGSFVADPAKNPGQDTVTLTVRALHGGSVLRLDFLTDTNMPGNGPGRAPNGNFAISEVEAMRGTERLALDAAWANATEGAWGPWQAIDGIADKGDNLWNAMGHLHQRRTLLLALGSPVKEDTVLAVRLICRSQWPQHVPGCLRAAVLAKESLAADIRTVAAAQAEAVKNAKFTWWDTTFCPRIALLDSLGRAVACENKLRLGLTPQTTAARIKELRAVREKRDAIWAQTDKASGPAKAEMLRQSLDMLGFANWTGNDKCYQFVHDRIKVADPKDESGAVRWLGFGAMGRDGAPGLEPVWKALGETNYTVALDLVGRQLADPRNKVLDHDRIQRIMLAKFLVYKRWPGHEEQRFDVQREIAALDTNTYLGIGALGYLAMYHKTTVPMITYGWTANQLVQGMNAWDLQDTQYHFDHPGLYKVSLVHNGGSDTVTVRRIAFMEGARVLAEAMPAAAFCPGRTVEVDLDLGQWQSNHTYVLRLEIETAAGRTNNNGSIRIEPMFQPTTTGFDTLASPAVQREVRGIVATAGSCSAWQAKLGDQLMAEAKHSGDDLAKRLAKSPLRAIVAKHEFVRVCGTNTLVDIARQTNGVALLAGLLDNIDWLEGFLDSGPSDRSQAIQNLQFLHQHGTELDAPIYQRLATAMALQVGTNYSRYRLIDRFNHIKQAHKQALLHISFDSLDIREMRWAIYLPGTAGDYQLLLDDRQTTINDYYGACWAVPYRDPNDYGYSVQGWGYVDPWTYYYGTGLNCRPLRAQKLVGGVCGTLSEYGASAAMAHGVMAVTAGQPGHCAYVIRSGRQWGIGFDVFGPCGTGFGVPGWDGTGYSVATHVWEPVEADRARFMAATRLAWIARLEMDRACAAARAMSNAAPAFRDWMPTYEQAIVVQPLNYGTWIELIKSLEPLTNIPVETWTKLGRGAAKAFAPYAQASWALADRCFENIAPTMKPADRLAYLMRCHQDVRDEKILFKDYPYGSDLDRHADLIGDPALSVLYFGKMLDLHFSKDPQKAWCFGQVMAWGQNRFSANPATASAYAKALETFFKAQGGADKTLLANAIAAGIRKASESGDLAAFRQWNAMADRMLPEPKPEDVYLNAAQVAARPAFIPFAGELLSRNGVVKTSSQSQYDKPLSYCRLGDTNTFGGYFDTNPEDKPWAQMELQGDSELTGIVLVNRYENEPEFNWAVPVVVSVSTDGKVWTEVARLDKAESVYRVDLQDKKPHARYVRIERQPGKPQARFHFRSMLVYGRKLY